MQTKPRMMLIVDGNAECEDFQYLVHAYLVKEEFRNYVVTKTTKTLAWHLLDGESENKCDDSYRIAQNFLRIVEDVAHKFAHPIEEDKFLPGLYKMVAAKADESVIELQHGDNCEHMFCSYYKIQAPH